MIRKIQLTGVAILLLIGTQIFAQKNLKKAEIQFELGAYTQAIESYKAHLNEYPTDWNAISRIAESFSKSGNDLLAAIWYDKLTNIKGVDPINYLKFGHSLKKTGRLEDARSQYERYQSFNPEVGNHFIESCDFALHSLNMPAKFETLVLPLNSNASDFALTFYNDFPVFSSFRKDILMTEMEKELNAVSEAHRSFIYNDKKKRLGLIKGIEGNFNHIGPVSFAANSQMCTIVESRILEENGFIHQGKVSTLYIALVNPHGEIIESKAFKHNEVGSVINSATLAYDGSAIYFSSNRKGGFGGFDIYVSYFNNGDWSLPQNLGPAINTAGDEITPFFNQNTLYFASDYHIGFGGFDIFSSEVINGKWQKPVNAGLVVNSISDDYFPCLHENELYFTSNRLGGKGLNDIYKAIPLEDQPIAVIKDSNLQPVSVSLDHLAAEVAKGTVNQNEGKTVSDDQKDLTSDQMKSARNVSFLLPEFDMYKVGSNAEADMSMEGARRIGLEELVPNVEVYFIQLASMSALKPNFAPFKPLVRYGNIYKVNSNRAVKIRLGYYNDRTEAEEVLKSVRSKGFKDAFITFEILNTAQMELVLSSFDEENFADKGNFNSKNPEVNNIKPAESGNKYKVRLASYEDPIWFDVNKVKDIGRVEQWTKGNWTIFILAGFNNMDEAKQGLVKAINRGFTTAEVVIDNGGILERIKQN